MVGITLSSEQVRNAPREVRHWLEQEVLTTFGWQLPAAQPDSKKLAVCSAEDAFKALSLIREMIPVVNVFFELGHAGASVGEGVEAFRLTDMQRHARLANAEQVKACLHVINDALRRVRNDDSAVFYGLDDRGYCFIAAETQRAIAQVWQQLVAERAAPPAQGAAAAAAAQASGNAPSPYPFWSASARPMDAGISGSMGQAKRAS